MKPNHIRLGVLITIAALLLVIFVRNNLTPASEEEESGFLVRIVALDVSTGLRIPIEVFAQVHTPGSAKCVPIEELGIPYDIQMHEVYVFRDHTNRTMVITSDRYETKMIQISGATNLGVPMYRLCCPE